jgi:3-hydroxyisobutyrate dehydrogenase-like beta-hydroxyacid dehydrogenase
MAQTVAMIGLGIMGSAISANLVKNGFTVLGFDVSDAAKAAARAKGVTLVGSPKEAAAKADVLLLSLPSVAALRAASGAPKPSRISAPRPPRSPQTRREIVPVGV